MSRQDTIAKAHYRWQIFDSAGRCVQENSGPDGRALAAEFGGLKLVPGHRATLQKREAGESRYKAYGWLHRKKRAS